MRYTPLLAALLVPLAWTAPTAAQTSPLPPEDFCVSWQGSAENFWQCYRSMAEAEAGLRAVLPASYRDVIQPKTPQPQGSVAWNTGLEEWRVDFFVPNQPPASQYPPVYSLSSGDARAGVCNASGDPLYPDGCLDGDAAALARYEKTKTIDYPQCTFIPVGFQGAYYSPFSSVTSEGWRSRWGRIHYTPLDYYGTRQWVYTGECPGWNPPGPVTYKEYISKSQSFLCPELFTPVAGYSNLSQSPSGSGQIVSGATCAPIENMPFLLFKMRQTASCPAGKDPKPCHPATGDKSRREVDFEFSGEAFARHYHSLKQTGTIPAFAPGWTHTFSDRVLDGGVSLMRVIRGDGNVEYFGHLGNNEYVSTQTTRKKLVKLGDNTYRIHDETGKVLHFDTAGRLVRQERSITGLRSIDFTYDGQKLVQAMDQAGRKLIFVYTGERLSRIELPDGSAVDYSYDANANFERVTYADGSSKQYHYNEAGLSLAGDKHALTGITAENGLRYSSYGYNANGRVNLSQLHRGDGTFVEKTTIDYSNVSQPVVTLPYGEVVTYTLVPEKAYSRVTSILGSNGALLTSYAGNGTGAAMLTSPRGDVTKYVYAAAGYESERIEAFGTPEERKFVTVRDASYRTTSVEIQAKVGSNYVTKQRRSYTYNARGQMLTSTLSDPAASLSRTTTLTYCEQADVTAATCPLVGLLMTVDGPRTDVFDVTTFTYRMADEASCASAPTICSYRKGDLWKVTNALGHASETLLADAAGRPLSTKDVNGLVVDIEYDTRGRATAYKARGSNNAVETDDRILRVEYWPTGLVKKVVLPDGAFTTYTYDDAHRLTAITDNGGNRIDYTRNGASRATKEETRNASGTLLRTLSRTYSTLDLLDSETDAYGRATTYTYDADENPNLAIDALTRVSDGDYDGLDRLKRLLQDVNGVAAESKLSYDALDNITRVTDPKGLHTDYSFNGLGDQTQLQSPDTGTTSYGYDSAGNRTSQLDARGITTSYGYDALNRLTSITYPTAAENVAFTFDATPTVCASGETFSVGRLSGMTDASGSTAYCYDRFGQMVRKVQTTNGQVLVLRYLYNVAGQLTSMVYPDGSAVDYAYDVQGRVTEVGATLPGRPRQVVLTGATYYPFGPIASWNYGNGRAMNRLLDQNYQPYSIETNGTGGLDLGYEFDAVGNLKRLRDADQTNPPLREYSYDGLDRLTETRDGAIALINGYGYDKTGNRTSTTRMAEVGGGPGPGGGGTLQPSTTSYTYAASSHRLINDGAEPREYDAVGNLVKIGSDAAPGGPRKNFGYNNAGRLSSASDLTSLATYTYNAIGERVRRSASSTDTLSLYDESAQWIGDYSGSGNAVQQLIWLGDLPVGVIVGNGATAILYYVEADMLHTPRVVVDPVRNVAVWRWELSGEAFGNDLPNENPDGDGSAFAFDLRFPGQRFDAPSGLNYNYFRDYDMSTGRYVQSDPIGLMGGPSTFGYVGGNALASIDPLGLVNLEIPNSRTSFHANPGPAVTGYRSEHGPAHVHLGSNSGPRINIRTFQPFSPEDARKMTPEMKKACANLSNYEKNMIRKRAIGVFKRGFFYRLINGKFVSSTGIVFSGLALRLEYDKNGGSMGMYCEVDPNSQEECPAEYR